MIQNKKEIDKIRDDYDSNVYSLPQPLNAFEKDFCLQLKTVKELEINQLKSSILEKIDYKEKIKDQNIKEKWIQEAMQQGFTKKEVEFVFQWITSDIEANITHPYNAVLTKDKHIPSKLKESFKKNASKLENVPKDKLDWHPGSNNQVLDLIHPSLYPFVKGKTKISKNPKSFSFQKWMGTGEIDGPSEPQNLEFKSDQFQWLPSDIFVDENGKVSFLSYINNLHPGKHKDLYLDLAKILEEFIPLFEKSLDYSQNKDAFPIIKGEEYVAKSKTDYYVEEIYDPKKDYVVYDDDKIFNPVELDLWIPSPSDSVSLKNARLQVIVKMANIYLDEKNPQYPGGTFHIEGMSNEDIVATGIYYYDVENITESRLSFRFSTTENEKRYHEHWKWNEQRHTHLYGLNSYSSLIQELGSIQTIEDRCVVFPNIYHHKVEPFELKDKSKPGHRKILVFFLINYQNNVLSTYDVPPQQSEWFEYELIRGRCFGKLPDDAVKIIVSYLDYPIQLSETKKDRLELMKERSYIKDTLQNVWVSRTINLCEH